MNNLLKSIIWGLLLLGSVACTDPGSGSISANGSLRIEIDPAFEDRSYDYGETIDMPLRIEQTAPTEDHCVFSIRLNQGAATFTFGDEPVVPGDIKTIYYNVIGESKAFKILHLTITPSVYDNVLQTLSFELCASTTDGKISREKHIEIPIRNLSEIIPKVVYNKAPLGMNEILDIMLSVQKPGYTGTFTVTAEVSHGSGAILLDGNSLGEQATFSIAAAASRQIQYRPTAPGAHSISLKFTDSIKEVTTIANCDVVGNSAGAYIYTVDGSYIPRAEWNSQTKAEGVALITEKCRFLIAPKSCEVDTWCLPDNLNLIPKIMISKREEALQDLDGKGNTALILEALAAGRLKRADMAQACANYDPESPGRWYMPAAGQLHAITLYFHEVQACLSAIGGKEFQRNIYYYGSTGAGHAWAYAFSAPDLFVGGCTLNTYKGDCYPVRDL